jgi:hypothetical protein
LFVSPLFIHFVDFPYNEPTNVCINGESAQNGDVLLETTRDIEDGFLGDVYLVGFMCIFAFTILSVFVSIIQACQPHCTPSSPLLDLQ